MLRAAGSWAKGEAAREGAGAQAHHASLWCAALQRLHLLSALGCSEGKSLVSALSDLVFSPPGFFPLWFYTDGPAVESRGLSCRQRETYRLSAALF